MKKYRSSYSDTALAIAMFNRIEANKSPFRLIYPTSMESRTKFRRAIL